MNRLTGLICGIVLLMGPYPLLAQHRGGPGGGPGRGPTGVSNSDELKDFKRAIALRASPDQVAQFRKLAASTQAARKAAQDLLQLAANASTPDVSHSTEALSSAVGEAQTDNEQFLRTFSQAQKSGLKDLTKKLGKTNSEITKQSAALGHSAHSGTDARQIAGVVEKLDQALSDFVARQSAIGTEMGIQDEKKPQ